MKKIAISVGLLFSLLSVQGQSELYTSLIRKADSLYNAKDYKRSALTYSEAFKSYGWKGTSSDRYNAACSAALANMPDTAFFYLNRAILGGYKNFKHISVDSDLDILRKDERWKTILEKVKANKDKAEEGLDKLMVAKLDSIHEEDQKYRMQMDVIGNKYGWDSQQMQDLWKVANRADSINLIKVKHILDTKGWLGPDVVGYEGSSTLFLVIQHSDQETQEKYLPMMREAAKKGKAQPNDLALLEDRVALGQGKKQIYGSQIGRDPSAHTAYVLPLEDPDNVDKRRAEVGLQPIAEYVQIWNLKWDVEEYKKNLPKDQGLQFTLMNKDLGKPFSNQEVEIEVVDLRNLADTIKIKTKTDQKGLMEKVSMKTGRKNINIKVTGCDMIGMRDLVIGESSYLHYTLTVPCSKRDQKKSGKEK